MKNFQFNRFKQVMRWTLLTEKRAMIIIAIACTAAPLMIQLFSSFSLLSPLEPQSSDSIDVAMTFCTIGFSVVCCFFASRLCSNASSSRQRAVALMLPASKSEKFLARVVLCFVILPVIAMAGNCVATVLRLLLELLAGHYSVYAGWNSLFAMFTHTEISVYLLELWVLSLFMLGGVFFRRVPFLWTWGLTSLLFGIFNTLVALFLMLSVDNYGRIETFFSVMKYVGYIALPVLTVFNVWMSYRLYCRLQVVQNRVFNI